MRQTATASARAILLFAGLIAVAVVLAGCRTARSDSSVVPANRGAHVFVSPRRIQHAFSERGVLLVDDGVFTSRDRPIIRSYSISPSGQLGNVVARVFVYASLHDANVAKPSGTSGRYIRHANIIVFLTRWAPAALRHTIAAALTHV